jgi:hypothetical protein
MADTKITALAAITTVAPANDLFAIVDVSDNSMAASGTTKNITTNQILGAGGTATLASATITGDLTVRTNKLAVTSTGVGVNYTSPAVALHVGTTGATNKFCINTAVTSAGDIQLRRGAFIGFSNAADAANSEYLFANGGALEMGIGGTTAMTLNSTGLGIGISPQARIHAYSASGSASMYLHNGTAVTGKTWYLNSFSDGNLYVGIPTVIDAITVTPSGNVGVGVTPSAWAAGVKGFEIGSLGSGISSGSTFSGTLYSTCNAYNDGSWKYARNAAASLFGLNSDKSFAWFQNSNSPSIGGAITWTQAMTLDASGNLLVGTTAPLSGNAAKFHLSTDSGTTRWAVGPYSSATNFIISAVGGSGVYLNGTAATSWTSASDERLKDIIEPISNAVSKVASLRAVIGKFKFDENNTRKPFLIAQDVQAVLPEAVDASNPDRLGVSYTDVIPLLVAAIKELTARVQTLEAR